MRLIFKGKEYRGHDSVSGKNISLRNGDAVEVSDVKGKQLLKDFAGHFVLAGQEPLKEAPAVVAPKEVEPVKKGRKK